MIKISKIPKTILKSNSKEKIEIFRAFYFMVLAFLIVQTIGYIVLIFFYNLKFIIEILILIFEKISLSEFIFKFKNELIISPLDFKHFKITVFSFYLAWPIFSIIGFIYRLDWLTAYLDAYKREFPYEYKLNYPNGHHYPIAQSTRHGFNETIDKAKKKDDEEWKNKI